MKRGSPSRSEHGARTWKGGSKSPKKKTSDRRTPTMIRSNLVSHLGLKFTDDSWADLLAVIDGKVSFDQNNELINDKALLRECEQLQAACRQLIKFCEGRTESGWRWANFLAQSAAEVVDENAVDREENGPPFDGEEDPDEKLLSSLFEKSPSTHDCDRALNLLQEMLNRVSEMSKFVACWHIPHGYKGAKASMYRESARREFAKSLSCHFIRAGGRFQAGGPAAFPQFLKLIWELLPPDCRSNRAESFADILSRLVSESDRLRSLSSADSHIQMMRLHWKITS